MGRQTIEHTNIAPILNHQQLNWLIKRYIKARQVLFICGPIGVGKSDGVRQAARDLAGEMKLEYTESIKRINDEKAYVVMDIRLSQMDPSDLRGLPIFDKENNVTRWLPPNSFPKTGHGLLFFDEENLAAPLVQASSYQLILSKCLGDYVLPDGYSIVAAGNRITDKANIFDLAAPLANRQGHVELRCPTPEEWGDWAIKNNVDPRIVGFIQFRQAALHTFDPKSKEKAFATPRTWAMSSSLIYDPDVDPKHVNETMTDPEMLILALGSMVGNGNANDFVAFQKLKTQLHPIEDYVKNGDTIDLPDDVGLTWALITSLVEYFRAHPQDKTLLGIVKVSKRISEEYATFMLKLMWAVDNSIQARLIKMPEANELAKKLWKFLQ